MSATPAPSPISTVDTPPVLNVAVTLDSSKTIEFAQPKIKGGVNLKGSFYKGAVADGPASWFAFGNSSAYDAQRGFDSRFGANYDQTLPRGGIAIIRCNSITFAGAPLLQLNGPTIHLALVGDLGINDTAVFAMDLSSLGSFTLATNSGNLALSNAGFTATGTTFKFLQLYQRGTGGVTLNGKINIPAASLYIDSAGNISLGGTSDITANRMEFNSTGTMNLNGALSANFLQLSSQSAINIKQGVASPNILYAFAPSFSTMTSLAVTGGRLQIGAGGIDAHGFDLTGFDNIITTGDLDANNISAINQLSVGGTFFAGNTAPTIISAFGIEMTGGLSGVGAAGAPGSSVTLDAPSVIVGSGPGAINGINLDGGDNLLGAGGDGGTLNIGTTPGPIPYDVTINAPITATTGSNLLGTGGNGGTVNVTSDGTVTVNSTIKVSDNTLLHSSRSGGNIAINSNKTAGTAINVSSSAQLLALLNAAAPGPGGSIKFTSAGGDVNINGATMQADRGTVDVRNNGGSGIVNVSNATLNASTVKVGALGNNGTLNVGGGTISADTLIKLYAGGSNGSVNFTNNVTLSGNSVKIIAGDAVTIFNGRTVTVLGNTPASVFTNNPNYTGFGGNGSTTGTFAGQGAVTAPLSGAPGF